MKYFIYPILLFVFSSCYKKINYTNELNTNLYDSLYSEGKWFNYEDYIVVGNPDDLNTMFRFTLKEGILPWSVKTLSVNVKVPGLPSKVIGAPESSNFGYIISNPQPGTEYCFTISVYTSDTNSVVSYLHPHTECVTYN